MNREQSTSLMAIKGQRSLVGLANDVSTHVTKTVRLLSSVHAICPTHDARNLRCLQKSGFMVCITPFDTNKHTRMYVRSFTYISSGLPQSFSESNSRNLQHCPLKHLCLGM